MVQWGFKLIHSLFLKIRIKGENAISLLSRNLWPTLHILFSDICWKPAFVAAAVGLSVSSLYLQHSLLLNFFTVTWWAVWTFSWKFSWSMAIIDVFGSPLISVCMSVVICFMGLSWFKTLLGASIGVFEMVNVDERSVHSLLCNMTVVCSWCSLGWMEVCRLLAIYYRFLCCEVDQPQSTTQTFTLYSAIWHWNHILWLTVPKWLMLHSR